MTIYAYTHVILYRRFLGIGACRLIDNITLNHSVMTELVLIMSILYIRLCAVL